MRVVATGEDAGLLYLAMAYVDGVDLRTLLREEGPLPPERALAMLAGVADALDAAHAAGLVHRDVTPGNVLVGRVDGQEGTYLADFGLARHASTPTSLTGERSFVGTIDYIAPEQIRGDPLDGSADQYALACVLFASLTGSPPFVRDTDVATVFAHLNERPPPASSQVPDLPPRLDAVLARGLAKEPAGRHADCRALLAAAEAALRGPPAAGGRVRIAALVGVATVLVWSRRPRRSPCWPGTRTPSGQRSPARPRRPRRPPPIRPARRRPRRTRRRRRRPDRSDGAAALRLDAGGVALIDVAARRVVAQAPLPGASATSRSRGRGMGAAAGRAAARAARPGDGRRRGVRRPAVRAGWPGRVAHGPVGERGRRRAAGAGRCRAAAASARGSPWTERAGETGGLAVGAGSLWLGRGGVVLRVDPASGRVLHRFRAPLDADRLAFGGGMLWVASSADGRLAEIDPATNAVVARPKLHGYVTDLAVADGAAWVTVTPEDRVYRLDPDDGSVQGALPAGPGPESVALVGGALLVANGREGTLARIDLSSGAREPLHDRLEPGAGARRRRSAVVASVPSAAPLPALADGNEVRVSIPGDDLLLTPRPPSPRSTCSSRTRRACAS